MTKEWPKTLKPVLHWLRFCLFQRKPYSIEDMSGITKKSTLGNKLNS